MCSDREGPLLWTLHGNGTAAKTLQWQWGAKGRRKVQGDCEWDKLTGEDEHWDHFSAILQQNATLWEKNSWESEMCSGINLKWKKKNAVTYKRSWFFPPPIVYVIAVRENTYTELQSSTKSLHIFANRWCYTQPEAFRYDFSDDES